MTGVPQPPLRPGVGFCVQTESTGNPPGRWYLNMCKHRMVDMPITYSGRPASRDWILANGIGNMQVPFDAGTFRKIKARADGAKQTTYCIDVVFNPFMIQMFMDDDFCKAMENFRPYVINLALKRIEESVGVKLSTDKVKLVKTLRYKDAEDDDGVTPKEFVELEGTADSFDAEVPKPPPPPEEDAVPLIEDVTPGAKKKPAIKKGFFNKKGAGGSLYGDNGSTEGVLPENAGDPMGWMPKKLRQTCKIVDCNDPEYQKNEQARRSTEATNRSNQEFKDTMMKDMDKWAKACQPDKWGEDLPDGIDPAEPGAKYDNDYSRFDKIEDVEEAGPNEDRDWYCDSSGNVRRRGEAPATPAPAVEVTPSAPSAPAQGKTDGPAIKKGFLDGAKSALYPNGSEQSKAPMGEQELMKELEGMMGPKGGLEGMGGADLEAAIGKLADAAMAGAPTTKKVEAKVADFKVPEFELNEAPEGLQLAVSVPGLTSMQGVNLDVTERQASLAFPGSVGLKPLQVALPSAVVPTEVRAKFSKKTQRITVTLPTACH